MIERCLAKDVNERYSATDDLARELRWVRDHLSEALAEPKVIAERRITLTGWRSLTALGTAALMGAMLVAAAQVATAPLDRALAFTPIASASHYEGTPMWSPDGQSLAYVADIDGVLQVFVRRISDATSHQVTSGHFDAREPFWAPDGQHLYYISLAGELEALWTVGVAGGRPELVLENVTHAAIDREGTRLALMRRAEAVDVALRDTLWWSSPPGAEPIRETRPPFDQLRSADGQLRFSPDGQLLVWMFSIGAFDAIDPQQANEFYVVPKQSGAPRRVLNAVPASTNLTPFDWMPDNRHLIVALPDPQGGDRHLWLADTRSDALRVITATHTNETAPAVSAYGRRIAYASDEVDFDLVLISPEGQTQRPLLATARNEVDPAWSPSGDQLAFVTDRTGGLEIWTRSRDGKWERPVVTAADFGSSRIQTLGSPAFSPDGRTLAYQRQGEGTFEIWLSPAAGGTPVRLISKLLAGGVRPYQDSPTWSPDGEWIAFVNQDGPRNVAKARIGTSELIPLVQNVWPWTRTAWSQDGKWIACQTVDGLVRVPADGGNAGVLTKDLWMAFTWAPDSRHLFALGESEVAGHFALVEIDSVTRHVKTLNPDLGPIPVANQPIRGFSFSKGQGFLTSLASARSDIWLLEGFPQPRGWFGRFFRR